MIGQTGEIVALRGGHERGATAFSLDAPPARLREQGQSLVDGAKGALSRLGHRAMENRGSDSQEG